MSLKVLTEFMMNITDRQGQFDIYFENGQRGVDVQVRNSQNNIVITLLNVIEMPDDQGNARPLRISKAKVYVQSYSF